MRWIYKTAVQDNFKQVTKTMKFKQYFNCNSLCWGFLFRKKN